MKRLQGVALVLALTVGAGCYHATVDTGLTPGPDKVENTFASSWIFGLVPPKTVETASRCPGGVARVETQLSFVNQLVGILYRLARKLRDVKQTLNARFDLDESAITDNARHPAFDQMAHGIFLVGQRPRIWQKTLAA